MAVNKTSILAKTHYGLNVFSWILRQYDGDAILSLRGRDCNPVVNPLLDNSLIKISIADNIAVFQDLNDPENCGDVFDFAAQHFQLEGQALFEKINEELYLRLDVNPYAERRLLIEEKPKIKVPSFSYFKAPVSNTIPSREIPITDVYQLIKGETFKDQTLRLQAIADKSASRTFKAANFDYVTFSGMFSKRSDKSLVRHSGLIALDFDKVEDVATLRQQLLQDEYFDTELLFVSPSGNGLKWVVSIDITKATHLRYFQAISAYIRHTYTIEVDQSGKDVSRACFLSYDPLSYINPKYLNA